MPEGISVVVENGFATVSFEDRRLRGDTVARLLDAAGEAPSLVEVDTSGRSRSYVVPENIARDAGLLDEAESQGGLTDEDKAAIGEWLTAEREYADSLESDDSKDGEPAEPAEAKKPAELTPAQKAAKTRAENKAAAKAADENWG